MYVAPEHPVVWSDVVTPSSWFGEKSKIVSALLWDGVVFPRKAPISLSFECKYEFQPSAGSEHPSYRKVLIFNQSRVFHDLLRAASFRKCWILVKSILPNPGAIFYFFIP